MNEFAKNEVQKKITVLSWNSTFLCFTLIRRLDFQYWFTIIITQTQSLDWNTEAQATCRQNAIQSGCTIQNFDELAHRCWRSTLLSDCPCQTFQMVTGTGQSHCWQSDQNSRAVWHQDTLTLSWYLQIRLLYSALPYSSNKCERMDY